MSCVPAVLSSGLLVELHIYPVEHGLPLISKAEVQSNSLACPVVMLLTFTPLASPR